MKPHLDVVAGLIKQGDKILISQRKENDTFGLLWEFPGGKIEEGESLEEALKREIKEELGVEIKSKKLIHTFEDETEKLKITVYLLEGEITKGKLQALECNNFAMVSLEKLKEFELAPVDKKILHFLQCNYKATPPEEN
ncbi:MAG: hypothetical protein B6D56_00985 [Candidatus Omnitrophica bacterium 4484_70.1]|nr:MAG: hypothetical protein B6D56_00985 [Candidatus Omnitrophica bacterium 4484_70.1]